MQSITGCQTTCPSGAYIPAENLSCSADAGCCELEVPKNLGYFFAFFNENYNDTSGGGCGYITVMEEKAFRYSTTYRNSTTFRDAYNGEVPVVMDWRISFGTCEQAKRSDAYACLGDKSQCVNTTYGPGYRCKCRDGYQGNPYISDGCTGSFCSLEKST